MSVVCSSATMKRNRSSGASSASQQHDSVWRGWPLRPAASPGKATKVPKSLLWRGPSTLQEVLVSHTVMPLRMLDYAKRQDRDDIARNFKEVLTNGIVLTTNYSGTGSYEAMSKHVLDRAAKELGLESANIVYYAACDSDPAARYALLNHRAATRPMHVFDDVLGRLPPRTHDELHNLEAVVLAAWEDSKLEHGQGNINKLVLERDRKRLCDKFLTKLDAILKDVDFAAKAYCHRCRKLCFISPRANEEQEYAKYYWVEGAGSTCLPFTSLGQHGVWLDPATLPFMTWLYSCRYYQPDAINHECVAGFPVTMLTKVLNDDPQSQLKCIHAPKSCASPVSVEEGSGVHDAESSKSAAGDDDHTEVHKT